MHHAIDYIVDTVELKKLMIEKGVENITEFSKLSGVGRDTVSGVLKGKIRPSTAVMEKFMVALDMQPASAGTIFFKPILRNA